MKIKHANPTVKSARILSLILLCALLLPFLSFSANSSNSSKSDSVTASFDQSISAQSAILIDAESGYVMFEKNSEEILGEASTTKIMTALVVAQSVPLSKEVTIPAEAVGVEGSSVYLCEGEILSVRELLLALLLESANDAAVALAIATSGSVEDFCVLMNKQAEVLGLTNTHFCNPHGLYDENHYTTARDLARISAEALNNDELRAIFSTKKANIPCSVTKDTPAGDGVRYLKNHNKMLSLYDGAIGIKTGFTKATGRCLVSAAERGGMTLIAVTLNAPDDWRDHTAMLDYGFANYERVNLYEVGEFCCNYAISGGSESFVAATNSEPIALTLPKDRGKIDEIVCFPQRFEIAPIKEGDKLGEITLSYGTQSVSAVLVAAYSVDQASKPKFKIFKRE